MFIRKPAEKLGIEYGEIKIKPFRSISVSEIYIHASNSKVVRDILSSILPSADISTADYRSNDAPTQLRIDPFSLPFRGSSISMQKIHLTMSLQMYTIQPNIKARSNDTTNNQNSSMSVTNSDVETNTSNDNTDMHVGSNSVATQKTPSKSNNGTESNKRMGSWFRNFFSRYPLPVLSLRVHGLCFDIDKAFLAPLNPDVTSPSSSILSGGEKLHDDHSKKCPAALPPCSIRNPRNNDTTLSHQNSNLPTFDQESVIEAALEGHINDADKISFYIDKWVKRVKKKSVDPHQRTQNSQRGLFSTLSNRRLEAKDDDDEGKNEQENENVIKWCRRIFKYAKVKLEDSVILISGVTTGTVMSARKKLHPHFASMFLAKVPISDRVYAAVIIKKLRLNQRQEKQNPELHLSGVSVHIGSHIKKETSSHATTKKPQLGDLVKKFDSQIVMNESKCIIKKLPKYVLEKYEWHRIAQVDLSLDVIGFEKIAVWLVSYDHQWDARNIGSNIEIPNLELNLLSKPIHQLMIILDDYFDPNSPVNEWKAWMTQRIKMDQRKASETTLREYRQSYLLKTKRELKGSKIIQSSTTISNNEHTQINNKNQRKDSPSIKKSIPNEDQSLKFIEKNIPFRSIMRQRSFVMSDGWKFPQSNAEFVNFLQRTCSSISQHTSPFEHDDDSDSATPASSLHGKIYRSEMDALISFLTAKFSFFAPHTTGQIRIGKVHVTLVQDNVDLSDVFTAENGISEEPCHVDSFCPITVEFDGVSMDFRKNSLSSKDIIARSSNPKASNFNSEVRINNEVYRLCLSIGNIILSPALFEKQFLNVEKSHTPSNDSLGILYKVSKKHFFVNCDDLSQNY